MAQLLVFNAALEVEARGAWRRRGIGKSKVRNGSLPEVLQVEAAPLNDAFQSANRHGFVPMHGHDDLAAISMPPFLVTARLSHQGEAVLPQDSDDLLRATDWKATAHGIASSTNFAPLFSFTGEGSNHNAKASRALAMASASVSPAVAHPGNSGNTADHRFASGSNSTKRRSFMDAEYACPTNEARQRGAASQRTEGGGRTQRDTRGEILRLKEWLSGVKLCVTGHPAN